MNVDQDEVVQSIERLEHELSELRDKLKPKPESKTKETFWVQSMTEGHVGNNSIDSGAEWVAALQAWESSSTHEMGPSHTALARLLLGSAIFDYGSAVWVIKDSLGDVADVYRTQEEAIEDRDRWYKDGTVTDWYL